MNSNLQTSKSILAKLLAAENITVSHQNVKTAMFDLKTRTLMCPVWKDMDGDLYDLLMGHEVGHALNTPEAGWHSAIHDENGKPLGKFKDFLNVIEDARIERQVKRKFPGLAKSFATAYKSLHDRDFFGIKNVDANKLNLIDRINIRYKMGAHIPVAFNDNERVFLVDIDNAETWEQVVDVARRVFDYCKQQKEEQKSQINNIKDLQEELQQQFEKDQSEFQDFNEEESDDNESADDSDDSDEDGTPEEDSADDSDYKDTDEEDSESNDGFQSGNSKQEDLDESIDDDPESVTDRNFRRREDELVNQSGEVFMIELPEAVLENIILQNKFVMNDLELFIRKQVMDVYKNYSKHGISFDTVAAKCVRKFNTNNKKFIMHILKEFEMRKKAADYARVQTAKTGELNMSVLQNYKFTNDLFKKISVVPKGKSHGMVMYVDMSGSMSDILRNTIEQCLVLVSFCRLAKIPFDVYGFSDDYYQSSDQSIDSSIFTGKKFINSTANEENSGHVRNTSFHLKHLIGSTLSTTDYRRSFTNLCIVANEYRRGMGQDYTDKDHGEFEINWDSSGFGLNGTPFQQTLLASRDMINNFRAKHKLDIVNVIYLTDGEGGDGIQMPWTRKGVCYLIDKKTKKKIRVERNIQTALTQLVRDVTGCKHLGFFLATKNDVSRTCKDLEYVQKIDFQQSKNFKKQFREEKFVAIPNLGYEKYFYIQSATANIQEDKMMIDASMNKNKMANEFSRSVNSKKTSRALVTQFAEEISASLKRVA